MSIPTLEHTKRILGERVELYTRNLAQYRQSEYKEAQLRREFLDPFFEALGWDVTNRQGWAEQYKEVVNEDALKVGGATQAPDYSFRIGGVRKFFAEAKKPSRALKADASSAYQLRRYAWSAKLPLSILSDFEELAIYDCRARPSEDDKASVGRINYLTYDEYLDRLPEIYDTFSKEAVLRGSFDRFIQEAKSKRGTTPVDAEFLKEIEGWRAVLAKNIATLNPRLTLDEMNDAVQRTIDRIIFLWMAEDRGTEPYGQLQQITKHADVYAGLLRLCQQADDRYNSGLFDFKADTLTPALKIDDDKLRALLGDLYYPHSPYEFAVLGADTLGNVYEQFLGKVIRLTASHQAKVEEKPAVKKAGGVFYTPGYIVEYIVAQTVGQLIEGKSPKDLAAFRVLDPACGSGSFLLGAYQRLLDHYLAWYTANATDRQTKGRIYESARGWQLATAEKKRILTTHIFGVDIDRQAVEVTKLSLLLKVLEGENQETLGKQLSLFRERALPNLDANIKCGNSLIGPDYFAGPLLPDAEELRRVNPFDWAREFPDVMRAGGFDCVIGNPPYVRQESHAHSKTYFAEHYKSFQSTADLYVYFMEKGLTLLRPGGLFSIIVSSSFLRTTYALPLRRFIRGNTAILGLVDFGGLSLFENAKDVYVCIPLIGKIVQSDQVQVCKLNSLANLPLSTFVADHQYAVPVSRFVEEGWSIENEQRTNVFEKVKACSIPLGEYVQAKIFYGIKTGLNEAFEITEAQKDAMLTSSPKCQQLIKPFLGGQDIRRYSIRDSKRFLIVIPSGWTRLQIGKPLSERDAWIWLSKEFSPIAKHLEAFEDAAKRRQDQGEFWWELRPCDYYATFESPKIIYPDIAKYPRFFFDTTGLYVANTAYCLGVDDLYLLGILNSTLAWFAISRVSIPFGTRAGEFRYRLIYQYMEQLPIRTINFADAQDKARHDRMVSLVEQMLTLHQQLASAQTAHDRELIQRQIDATDHAIDDLVYQLYELSEEEIRLVQAK